MTTPTPDDATGSTTSPRPRPAPATARRPGETPDEQRRREVLARARQLRATPRSTTARPPAPDAARSPDRSTGRPTTATSSRQAAASPQAGRHERGALQRWRERSYGHGEAPLRALLAAASEAAALTLAVTSPRPTPQSAAKPGVTTGQPDDRETARSRPAAARPSPPLDMDDIDDGPRTTSHSRGPDRQHQL